MAWLPGIAVGMAIGGRAEKPSISKIEEISKSTSPELVSCYAKAYRRKTRNQNLSAAFAGGMFGMSFSLLVVLGLSLGPRIGSGH